MRVQILLENIARDERLAAAHGLSVYIETAHHKVLVDAGSDARISENAKKLGIDLMDVDTVVLSHGHYDHSGGLTEFLRLNKKATIYAGEGFAKPHYDQFGRYIGVEPALIGHPQVKEVSGNLKIDDELKLLNFNHKMPVEPINTCGMTEGEIDGSKTVRLSPETYDHEHYLLVTEGDSNVLFSGCSHKGIVNISEWAGKFRPKAIFGGFHLMDVKQEEFATLDHIAEELKKTGIVYYTGHCTGMEQFEYLKGLMGDSLEYAAGGDVFEF